MMLKKIFILILVIFLVQVILSQDQNAPTNLEVEIATLGGVQLSWDHPAVFTRCLLYTSPSPRDRTRSRMPSSA